MVDEGGSGSSSLMSTIFSGDKNRTRSDQLIPIIKIHWDDVEDPLIVAICIGFDAKNVLNTGTDSNLKSRGRLSDVAVNHNP